MATQAKVVEAPKVPDTMRIWSAVERTDPAHTKKVNQRGGFTAIDAQYQIMEATRQFGPIGEGWGYHTGEFQIVGNLIVVPVTLWHTTRGNEFGPILGCAEMLGQRPDRDAPKKAITDALTKGLSQLGFNADVFLGKFDDNKYVEEAQAAFHPANDTPADSGAKTKREPLQGPYTSKTALWQAVKLYDREVRSCGDLDSLEAFLAMDESKALVTQLERDAPQLLHGGEGLPEEYEPLLALVSRMRTDLNAPTYLNAG